MNSVDFYLWCCEFEYVYMCAIEVWCVYLWCVCEYVCMCVNEVWCVYVCE